MIPGEGVSIAGNSSKKWLRNARIAASDMWVGMSDARIRRIVDELAGQGVNTVDIDVSANPVDEQIDVIKRMISYARATHPSMKFFTYQAPLEIISENVDLDRNGKVDPGKTSIFSEHPEWAQRGLGGEPAVFYGADAGAFWVGPKDEDAWLCPNDPEYRKVWTAEIAKLAQSGVDGIYIDVPFLKGWFDDKRGWRWACACEDCASLYRNRFGSDLPDRADWNDANFRRFVRWRFEQIENFIKTIRKTIRTANRKVRLIIEHWDGLSDSLETACDPARLAAVSDVRTHEWTNVNGSTGNYHQLTWLEDYVRYASYRAMDGSQPSWILAYSNKGDARSVKALAALLLNTGCNFWETDKPDMSGSANDAARTSVFNWIGRHENIYYDPGIHRIANIGLYFSRDSVIFGDFRREMEPDDAMKEFLGLGMILLQEHLQFRVVTSTDQNELSGLELLILPNSLCLSEEEVVAIEDFVSSGGILMSTGNSGDLDEDGNSREETSLSSLFGNGKPNRTIQVRAYGAGTVVFSNETIGSDYYRYASPDRRNPNSFSKAGELRIKFGRQYVDSAPYVKLLTTDATPTMLLSLWQDGDTIQVRSFDAGWYNDESGNETHVRLQLPTGKTVGAITYYNFPEEGSQELAFNSDGGYVEFVLPPGLHGTALLTLQ